MRAAWLTQNSIPDRRVVAISLPDDEQWRAQFLGALLLLTGAENWELFGELTPDQMAAEWLDIFTEFTQGNTSMVPVGTILEFAGDTLPEGFLWARGENVSRETYSRLWDEIGPTYGDGDGVTTFTLPDRRQRVGMGYDGSHSLFDTLGETGGQLEVTLVLSQMPTHNHSQPAHTHSQPAHTHIQDAHSHTIDGGINAASGAVARGLIVQGSGSNNTVSRTTIATNQNAQPAIATAQPAITDSGGGDPHTNLSPYIAMNYIIKY